MFPPAIFLLIQVGQAIIAAYTINAVFAFGEELGWRGYLLKSLQGKKFFQASLIIGVVWGLWHFPLILIGHNYPQHPVIGVGMMIVFCVLLTPMMIYITLKSKSVITAAIFHGSNKGYQYRRAEPCTRRLPQQSAYLRYDGVLTPSFPHSLSHVRASTATASLRSSITPLRELEFCTL